MAPIYAKLINQLIFKYQTVFSAKFNKQDENGQILDQIELYNNLNFNPNLTQCDIDKNYNAFQLEHLIKNQEAKDSGWRFDKTNSLTLFSLKLLNWMIQIMWNFYWDLQLSWKLKTTVSAVSRGHLQLVYIIVIVFILIEYQNMDKILLN